MALDDHALPDDFVDHNAITAIAGPRGSLLDCCHQRVHAPRGFGKTILKRFAHSQVSDRDMSILINFDQNTHDPLHEIFFCLQADAWRRLKQDPNELLTRLTQPKREYGLGMTRMLVSEYLNRTRRSFDEEIDKLRQYCEDTNLKKLEYFREVSRYKGSPDELDVSRLLDFLDEWRRIAYGTDDSYLWIDVEASFNWIEYGPDLLTLLNDRLVCRAKNPLVKLFLSTTDMNRHLKGLAGEFEEVDLTGAYDLDTLVAIANKPFEKRHNHSIKNVLSHEWIQQLHSGLPHHPNFVLDRSPKAWRDFGDLLARIHAEKRVSLNTEEDWKHILKSYFEAHIKLKIENFKGEIHVWVGNRHVKLRPAVLQTLLSLAKGISLSESKYAHESRNRPNSKATALRAIIEPLHDTRPSSNKHKNDPFLIYVVTADREKGPQLFHYDSSHLVQYIQKT